MKFRIGDKVKFLNEKGGGVVRKIISPSLVLVEIDDGFEIPVMPSELVLDSDMMETISKPRSGVRETSVQDVTRQEAIEYDERKTPIDKVGFRGVIPEGLYLAFVPHDQKWLITGELDILLINNTGWEIMFSYFLQNVEGRFEGIDYDMLEPKTKILIETIDREDLEKWTTGVVQAIFINDEMDYLLLPANCNFDIKASRIYKEGNYKHTPLVSEKAFVFSLLELNIQPKFEGKASQLKFDQHEKIDQKAKEVRMASPIDKHKTVEGEAIVDLHIGELIDNILGLSNWDMLKIQKDYFEKMLDSAIKSHYRKVTFIHGVGNGVLKNEIVNIMKEYEGLENQSASLAKFGVGAIDVLIH
jgi:Domain of unknown function (DUF2027)/Smr domain